MKVTKKIAVLALAALSSTAFAGYTITGGEDASMTIAGDLIAGFGMHSAKTGDADALVGQGFELNRGRINFKGKIDKDLGFRVRMRFQKASTLAGLTDYAYLTYKFADYANLELGKIFYGASFGYWDSTMAPITFATSVSSSSISPQTISGFGLGMALSGKFLDMFQYRASLTNNPTTRTKTNKETVLRYDAFIDLNAVSKSAPDFGGYDVDGDLRYQAGFTYGNNVAKTYKTRVFVSPYALVTINGVQASFDSDFELTKDTEHKSAMRFNAAYTWDKFLKPGFGIAMYKGDSTTNWGKGATEIKWADVKSTTVMAGNLTMFSSKGKMRTILEVASTTTPEYAIGTVTTLKRANMDASLRLSVDI